MMNVGRIMSYMSISIVLLFGIAVTTGIFFDLDAKMRITVGLLVVVYCVGRFVLMIHKPKRRSLLGDEWKGNRE